VCHEVLARYIKLSETLSRIHKIFFLKRIAEFKDDEDIEACPVMLFELDLTSGDMLAHDPLRSEPLSADAEPWDMIDVAHEHFVGQFLNRTRPKHMARIYFAFFLHSD
jgi:hypothetical protein